MLENQVGNVSLMQKLNRLKVLNIIRHNQRISRGEISALSGLSVSSVTNLVNYLISRELVAEAEKENVTRVGRKASLLEFEHTSYNFVCLAVSENEAVTALCTMNGSVLDLKKAPVPDGADIEQIAENEIQSIILKNPSSRIIAIGIAVSAMVTDGGNTVFSSTFKRRIHGFADKTESKFALPVFIENLSIINALYHVRSSFSDNENLLFIDFAGGIGAAQFFRGEINRAFAGEIGHTTVDRESRETCVCGNRGCLELLCSTDRVARKAGIKPKDILTSFEDGDEKTAAALGEYTEYLGIMAANLIDTLGPDKIILNGAELFENSAVYKMFIDTVKDRAYPDLMEKTDFTLTATTPEQRIYAMALYLCERVFDISFEGNIVE
ncbi:MAG: ROK family transcriptional regulator [Clostridia bacterium]|nr:ROK family transcriptional regulator [Clostridia bacterium]